MNRAQRRAEASNRKAPRANTSTSGKTRLEAVARAGKVYANGGAEMELNVKTGKVMRLQPREE